MPRTIERTPSASHRASAAPARRRSAATAPLISLLADGGDRSVLLPRLHQHGLEVTGGSCSLLFELNPRTGALHPTSAFGLDRLAAGPWEPQPPEAALVAGAFDARAPIVVAEACRDIPELAARLRTPAALLLPLVRANERADERAGLLAIGFAGTPPATLHGDVPAIADAFLVALEVSQLRERDRVQRDLRQQLEEFAHAIATTLQLSAGLGSFCRGVNQLFGANRTSVWIHDRRGRRLVLHASSDPQDGPHTEVPDDPDGSAAAAAMRRRRALVEQSAGDRGDDDATVVVTVPLRGCRRALGAVVFEGVRLDPAGEFDVIDRAEEIGRRLSTAVENLQLIDDVMRSRRELEDTFNSIAHLVVVADQAGRIVHVNTAFARRVGEPRERLVDRRVADLVGPELRAWLAQVAAQPAREGQPRAAREITDPVLKGAFLVTVTELLNPARARAGSVIVARDLTSQTRLEVEREELRQRLTQSEKLAALGQIVAGIAHELNNPLQGVLGHLELLRVTGAFPAQLRREVRTIYREADRAAKIVRNLLIFAGSHRTARRPVSVHRVLEKVVALRARSCRGAGIEVVRHYGPQLPRVQSDPLLLQQVFLNMLMNAEQAIQLPGGGGRIEISAALAPSRHSIVAVIRDTGPGIQPDALSRVFEPFFTTKEVGKGTGLGLAIAYGIVQDHGGHITAANHPDGGAQFTVELPVAAAAAHRAEASAD